MKKCPYCKTMMNDDVNTCPNCLKDMSSLRPMPEISPKDNKKSFNALVYGAVIGVGGILASISQGVNKKGYQVKYDELAETIKTMSAGIEKDKLIVEASEYLARVNECQFREIAFLVISAIGFVMIVVTLILSIRKKLKNKKEK